MKVRIRETMDENTLEIIDPNTNENWFKDFCNLAQQEQDGVIEYDQDLGEYLISEEDFRWWRKVSQEHEALNRRLCHLKKYHSPEEIEDIVLSIQPCDLEDEPGLLTKILNQRFGKGL